MSRLALPLVLALLCLGGNCNIWDNMYSQTYAQTPILLKQSLNLDFRIPQYSLKGNFDFNNDLSLLTVAVFFDMIVVQMEVLKVQLDLQTLTLSTVQAGSGCQRYKLEILANAQLNSTTVSKSSLFLINLLFKYLGKQEVEGVTLQKYKFEPFLFSSPEDQFDRVKEEIQKNVDEEYEDPLEDLEPDFDLQLYLLVDPLTGSVKSITEGKKQTPADFELLSKVKTPIACDTPVKTLTAQDIKNMGQYFIKNRGNYDKLIPKPFP